jgi:hypothetical protein
VGGWYDQQVDPTFIPPPTHPAYSASRSSSYDPSGDSWGATLHDTFMSFILGRDPGVATVREIESSFYLGRDPSPQFRSPAF